MRSKMFRPWIQASVLVVCFAGFVLIGVLSLTMGGALAQRDYPSIAIYAVVTAAGAYGLWRATRLGVRVGSDGLRLRSLGRDRLVPWSTITAVTADESDNRFWVPIYAPIITVAGQPKPVPLAPMSSYSRANADRRAALLRTYIANAKP